jgi:AhpD family alkylhydroperoxidase
MGPKDTDMSQRINYNAASPAGMKALHAVHGYVRRSGLPSRLVDLVFLRVSQINGCAYCIDAHSRDLLKGGLPVEHLVLVAAWPEAGNIFSEVERAALAWAEDVTRLGDRRVPDSAFEAAAAAFGEKQIVDLTLAIALMNAYNRMAISFRATAMTLARRMSAGVPGDGAAVPSAQVL